MSNPKIETHSQTWWALKAFAETGLDTARKKLEQHGASIGDTEFERGKIKAYREMLALADVQPVISSIDPKY